MTKQEIIEKVNLVLCEEFELDPGQLNPSAKLNDDLELDSLDGVDLVVALEKAFDFKSRDEEAVKSIKTVEHIYSFINKILN